MSNSGGVEVSLQLHVFVLSRDQDEAHPSKLEEPGPSSIPSFARSAECILKSGFSREHDVLPYGEMRGAF